MLGGGGGTKFGAYANLTLPPSRGGGGGGGAGSLGSSGGLGFGTMGVSGGGDNLPHLGSILNDIGMFQACETFLMPFLFQIQ